MNYIYEDDFVIDRGLDSIQDYDGEVWQTPSDKAGAYRTRENGEIIVIVPPTDAGFDFMQEVS